MVTFGAGMSIIEVDTKEQLKLAMKSGASEIVIRDEALLKHFRTVRRVKRYGPVAVGGMVAAIAAAVPTAGLSVAGL